VRRQERVEEPGTAEERQDSPAAPATGLAGTVLRLQNRIGNAAVARLLQRRGPLSGAPGRTIARVVSPVLDYETLATRINTAIEGWGTDEEAVYEALQQLRGDPAAIAELKTTYMSKFKESLEDAIRGDFSGTELEYALQLIGAGTPGSAQAIGGVPTTPAEWTNAAARIRTAVEGWGTDEEAVYAVLRPLDRNPDHIDKLSAAYNTAYGEDMVDRLRDEFSGSELAYVLYLLRLAGSPGQQAVADEAASMVGQDMTWTPSGPGSGNTFETWASAPAASAAPAVSTITTINCWEMVLLAAFNSGQVSWQWIHDLYTSSPVDWDKRLVETLSGGARVPYAAGPGARTPLSGDIVFFSGADHVALATGTRDSLGRAEVISFWPPPGHSSIPGTVDNVKRTTIEELVTWWTTSTSWAPPVVEYAGAPW
jgi:hypothetical protein